MIDIILENMENKHYSKVKSLLSELFVQDIAEILEEVKNPEHVIKIFRLLTKSTGAEVFSYINSDLQEGLVTYFSDKELQYIIEELYIDDAVDFLDEMPANVVERVLKNSKPETRQLINKLLQYEEDTAGSVMTTEFVDFKLGMTVENALARIRRIGKNVETINVLFVTNNERVLMGVLSIRDLLLADSEEIIDNLMEENVIFTETSTDQETIANTFKKYDMLALPVVDKERRLVGLVTVDDIVQIITEEATEDISKMAAITPTDKPYLRTSILRLFLSRFPWLLLLMVSSTFTRIIITQNEAVLIGSAFGIILTASIPMLMDTVGNAGGQASATIIRGMALDEIKFKDIAVVIWKELRAALLLGVALAVVCFGKLLYIDGLILQNQGVLLAAVICLAMFATVIIAKVVGCSLPIIAKACKLDPAVMASPLITTILDILSLLVLCWLSVTLLPV